MTDLDDPAVSVFTKVPAFKKSRLLLLYSDFSHLIDSNPEGYDANIHAWCELLKQCLVQHTFGSSLTLPGQDLAIKLRNEQYGEPKGLGLVLLKQVQEGKYVPWSIYKDIAPNHTKSILDFISPSKWIGRAYGLVRTWAFSPVDRSGHLIDESYILWDVLVETGQQLNGKLHDLIKDKGSYTAKLLDGEMFRGLVRTINPHMSELDIQVLLIYLHRDIGLVTVKNDEKLPEITYIKMEKLPITEQDLGIINIKKCITDFQKRVKVLERRLDEEIPGEIKRLLEKESSEERVKNILRQKSALKKSLVKSLDVLNQLTHVLEKINDAENNVVTFEAMKEAKDVLSSYNSKLSLAEVDDLQIQLDEQIETTNELSAAMAVTNNVDETEIDEELAKLEEEYGTAKSQPKEATPNLPSVPKSEDTIDEAELEERVKNLTLIDTNERQGQSKEEKKPEEPLLAS